MNRGGRDSSLVDACIAGFAATLLALACAHGRHTPYDNYVLFADALKHGRLWIDWHDAHIDAVLFDGRRYIVNDPVPALLLFPFVLVWGTAVNQTLLACVLCGVATGAAWWLFRRLGVAVGPAVWLTIFALAGTDLLWCSMLGDVWFLAQTSAVAFTLLALCEAFGRRRGWLVGLWFALALGSRFTLIGAFPVLLWWCWRGTAEDEPRPRSAFAFAAALVPFWLLWVSYNLARWHVPWDAGHTIFYHQDPYLGSPAGSPFSLGNVVMELYSYVVLPPTFSAQPPYVIPENTGTALWFTSPALLLAFFARRPRRTVIALWLAAALVAAPSLLYYANGGAQFGMRHALDFEPFVLVLMALAARDGLAVVWCTLIGWSALVSAWGIWYWNVVVRGPLGPGM